MGTSTMCTYMLNYILKASGEIQVSSPTNSIRTCFRMALAWVLSPIFYMQKKNPNQ